VKVARIRGDAVERTKKLFGIKGIGIRRFVGMAIATSVAVQQRSLLEGIKDENK